MTGSAIVLDEATVATLFERADIILIRGNELISLLIRWATRSYWNHVAIVFVLADEATGQHEGYRRTFIIEAEPHGIDIHPVNKYLDSKKQDMVILRLPAGAIPDAIRIDFMRRVRGFALEEIDAGYGFSAIGGIILRLFGSIAALGKWIADATQLLFRTPGVAHVVQRWICSGVVQFAYYRACFGADPATGASWDPHFDDPSHREGVVFNSDVRPDIAGGLGFPQAEERLRLTTPAHFALAANFGTLKVVAERIGGSWGTRLTRI